jgi:hypothetical protein
MKHIFIRPVRDSDFSKMVLWGSGNQATDLRVLNYPSTIKLCAFTSEGALAYVPIQQPLLIEAIAFHPLLNDLQKAAIMKEFTHAAITQAYVLGKGEVYFMGSQPATDSFATRHGFELISPVYRTVLAELEKEEPKNGKP